MKRRNLILLLGGASSGAMSMGTGAFSSVEAERDVEVNVVKDENAYLGITQFEESRSDGETVAQITNQFPAPLELTVTLDSSSGPLDRITVAGKSLDADSAIQIHFDIGASPANIKVKCREAGQVTFSLKLTGEIGDEGGTVRTTEEFQMVCEGDENEATPGGGPPEDSPSRGPPEDSPSRGPPEEPPGRGPPEEPPGRGPPEEPPGRGSSEDKKSDEE